MMKYFILLSSCYALAFAELAKFLKPCSRSSSELNTCILENLEALKPYLAQGIPDLQIPSLNVTYIPYSFVNTSTFEFGLWNNNVTGLDNFFVQSVEADLEENKCTILVLFPYLQGMGACGIKGKLFNMNFDSMGDIFINGSNFLMNYTLHTKVIEKHGDFYMKVSSQEAHVKLTNGSFYLNIENLYLGSKKLTQMMNEILNDNYYYLYEKICPLLQNSITRFIGPALDKLFERYTYDELLP
ncbi:PREDICTED: uncharacterized protein LOC108567939 [Nicrophorus vespilloides]|uniref:Uncharacterized protein LOC108567939 n=1 Tax=Nicrophorus vespilloides TaxID=110193 RepID=A0ABM1NBP6_NICVS|nr:PREDICTED: uncharacterized protein LOC108567939 [Nicrophorus vespilloides]